MSAIDEMAKRAAEEVAGFHDQPETAAIIARHYRELEAHRGEVSDGFGSTWPPCAKHNRPLDIMRPGSARCLLCENEEYREECVRELVLAARELEDGLTEERLLAAIFSEEWPGRLQPERERLGAALEGFRDVE